MNILSNDYLSNVSPQAQVAHGGPPQVAHALSTYATAHGHTWIGIVQRWDANNNTRIVKKTSAGNKTYYFFSYPHAHSQSFLDSKKRIDPRTWFAPQIDQARTFIRRVKPDVLFLNGYSVYGWILLEAARCEQLPIVTQHAGISQVEFEQYKHMYSRATRMSVLEMERDIVQAASKQIFLNDYSREAFCTRVAAVPASQAVVVPLPYQELFAQSRRSVSKKNALPVIGCVARWDRIKNHAAVLAVAREAKAQGFDWNFKSVTKIIESPVQRRFKEAYRKTIEVIAPMSPSDLMAFYDSVDLLILPSHFDVSPTVVMEAALRGKGTLISPHVGWVSEYTDGGLDEWIIDFSDARRVVERIQSLLGQPVSKRFQTVVRTKHDPKRVFASYLRLLASVT
jgi:glycosyltransferase involved in cell wall biosynthesis